MKPDHPADRPERSSHHNVYVVELDPSVRKIRRFREANPDCSEDKSCLYVGLTGLTPEERFARHKSGIQCSVFVKKYGVRLLPELYEYLNPMPYEAAAGMESDLADDLRAAGHGVWQH
jgi:predicted GIY-YIG superfamily endonuclease